VTVKERLNVKMIAGEEKVKCAWMIRHWHPHGCPYGYPSKCLQGTDIRTDVHNLWPVTWISARLSVWTIPCRVICATDSSTIFGMKGSDCCTSKHTPTTFFSSAIISSLSYFCRHLFMLSVFPLIGIYTLSFQVGIYTLSFQVWYRVTHVICAPNYFFLYLIDKNTSREWTFNGRLPAGHSANAAPSRLLYSFHSASNAFVHIVSDAHEVVEY